MLFDIYRNKLHHATELSAVKRTVAEALAEPGTLTFCISSHEPDYPVFGYQEILDCSEAVPELEALHWMAMVLHNQYPWDLADTRLEEAGEDRRRRVRRGVRAAQPRGARLHPARQGGPAGARRGRRRRRHDPPAAPVPPVIVRDRFAITPRLEALAVAKGERVCRNDDVIRNSAYSWSPMSAEDISQKTGIEARLYTERELDEISLSAAAAALDGADGARRRSGR